MAKTNNRLTLRGLRGLIPRKWSDFPPYLFTAAMIPITYYFEVFIVLPEVLEPGSVLYLTLLILGHFILYNIVGNMLGILLVDTSISGRVMPPAESEHSKFCSVCETITPPRSYHCPDCNICILKRDHHCKFTGCCIGHYNYRYFVMFLLYLLLGILIALPLNIVFLWDTIASADLYVIPKILFPLIMLTMGPLNIEQVHIAIAVISIVAMFAVSAWFYFHANLVLSGRTVHEMRRCINLYNLGRARNMQEVLGKRWHVAWLSPVLASPLPSDGIQFDTNPDHGDNCTDCSHKYD